jgi:hypothetical protein
MRTKDKRHFRSLRIPTARTIVTVLSATVLVLTVAFAGLILNGLWHMDDGPRRSIAHMKEPAVYTPIAKDLASYCAAADDITFPDNGFFGPWGPASARALHPEFLEIHRDEATLAMGGGFHHWGYHLTRDPAASTPTTDAWSLALYDEDRPDKLLFTFTSPTSAKISRAAFIAEAVRGYDEEIASQKFAYNRDTFIKEKAAFESHYLSTTTAPTTAPATTKPQ